MLKKLLVLGIGLAGIAGITWAAAVFGELTEIQAGGIFFLGVGIFYYFTILWKGFPKRKKVPKNPPGYEADRILEEFQEEEEDWEPEQKQYLTGALQMEEKDSQEEFGTTTLLKTSYAGNYAALVSMEPEKRENIVLDRDTLIVGKMPAQADVVLGRIGDQRGSCKIGTAAGWLFYNRPEFYKWNLRKWRTAGGV